MVNFVCGVGESIVYKSASNPVKMNIPHRLGLFMGNGSYHFGETKSSISYMYLSIGVKVKGSGLHNGSRHEAKVGG